MNLLLAIFAAVFALLTAALIWRRTARAGRVSRRLSSYAALAGAVGAVAAVYGESMILRWTGLAFDVREVGTAGALMATFLLAAPLEEAAKVLVVWPLYRTRRIDRAEVGVSYAVAAAAGFAAVEGAWLVWAAEASGLSLIRTSLSTIAQIWCAGAWGYALGAGRIQARWFSATWLFAVLLHGLFDHIVWGRGPGYLGAALPLLAFMALGAWLALRDVSPEQPTKRATRVEPPRLSEVQEALRTHEKPVMVRWVIAGAFVTLGLVITLLGVSIFLGHRLGFDFALADEADVRSAAPLLVLGTAVLSAFPISGYLVARASGTPSVLEPVLANLLALAAMVALFALAAPVAVLFALAVTPIALGLSCGGAWIGVER